MAIHLGGTTIDCENPRALAEFWAAAMDYKISEDYGGEFIMLLPEGGTLGKVPYLGLQRVPEKREGKNRAHLDFHAEDRLAEVERLVGLGASVLGEEKIPGLTWSVLADPEGNEFCVASATG